MGPGMVLISTLWFEIQLTETYDYKVKELLGLVIY